MTAWRVLHRTTDHVALGRGDAVLVIEASRVAVLDPELEAAIARLAPHLAFAARVTRGDLVERVAIGSSQRVVVGRLVRGGTSATYVLASRDPIEVDAVVAEYLRELPSPFDHFAD